MQLETLMVELAKLGVAAEPLSKDGCLIGLRVDGFSKSGSAELSQAEGYVLCETRYGRKKKIESVEDLIEEAWYWYEGYSERQPFTVPHYHWLPHFLKRGWVQEVKSYKVTRT